MKKRMAVIDLSIITPQMRQELTECLKQSSTCHQSLVITLTHQQSRCEANKTEVRIQIILKPIVETYKAVKEKKFPFGAFPMFNRLHRAKLSIEAWGHAQCN